MSASPGRGLSAAREPELAGLGTVFGELAHDLANDLTVLHGWAMLARGELAAGRAPDHELGRVLEMSEQLGEMLRDLLETAAGRPISPEVEFDPAAVTEAAVARRIAALSDRKVRLRIDLPVGTRVAGRGSFWVRLLANLIGNAARHARRELRVGLVAEGGWVVLEVEDDGSGIPAGERERIWSPFLSGDAERTGLGLGSARWAARQLGGEVECDGGGALGGALFRARVPVARSLGRALRPLAATAGALAGVSVVLVDDNASVRRAVVPLLSRQGARARGTAPGNDGGEALLAELAADPPDLLLLDLRMGGRGGVEIWERLGTRDAGLASRVVFVSGSSPGDPEWDRAEATGQPVLAKPFDLEQLRSAAARVGAVG